jgi:hypothetical protein
MKRCDSPFEGYLIKGPRIWMRWIALDARTSTHCLTTTTWEETRRRAARLPSPIRNSFSLKAAEHGIDQGINIRIGEVDRIAVVWK